MFLGPECVTNEETKQFVESNFDLFFEHYLEMWCTDESRWPKDRTLQMFRDWFTVRIHSMVLDTVDEPLRLE